MVSKEDRKSKRSARQRPSSKTSSKLGATIKDQSGQGRIRIGEILSKEGQITSIQLDESKKIHQKTQERLSSILLSKGYIDPDNGRWVTGVYPEEIANAMWNYKIVIYDQSMGVHNSRYAEALLQQALDALRVSD